MLPAQVAAGATTPLAGHLLLPAAQNTQQDSRKSSHGPLPSKGSFSICLPPGSRGAFPAPKIPPNSLPEAESSSTRGGLENTQGFGKGWEQTSPSNSHWRAWIWRDVGLGGLSTPWRGAGGGWEGQRDPLPRRRDTARENLLQPGVKSCHWRGARSSVLATAFPHSIPGASRTIPGSWGSPQNRFDPCSAFPFQMPPCHSNSASVMSSGLGTEPGGPAAAAAAPGEFFTKDQGLRAAELKKRTGGGGERGGGGGGGLAA